MTYDEFDEAMEPLEGLLEDYFVKGFKAPGWQISDGVYQWLLDHGWWVADQAYNNDRRPKELKAYVNNNGSFYPHIPGVDLVPDFKGLHYHTWNCVGNGVYELSDQIKQDIQGEENFKFVSEVLDV